MSVIVTEKDIASLTDALGREQHRTGELSAELRDLKAASVSVVQAEIMSNQAFVAGYDALAAEVSPVLKDVAEAFRLYQEDRGPLGVRITDLINRIEQVHSR